MKLAELLTFIVHSHSSEQQKQYVKMFYCQCGRKH